MKSPWRTYAIVTHAGLVPAPGCSHTIAQVENLAALGRAKTRPLADREMRVMQYRMVETRDAI